MASNKRKIAWSVVWGGLLIVALLVTLECSSKRRPSLSASLRLPVGKVAPVVRVRGDHVVILASDGSLWSCGDSTDGWSVLGLGNITNQKSLRRIGNDKDWVSVSISAHHALALKSNGSVWGWGENIYGQVGDGTSGRGNAERSTPVRSAAGNDWKQVATGGSHSLALKNDGTLWAWGNNWAGQLGIGLFSPKEPDAIQVGTGTNWVRVWAGLLESVAVQSDGSLWYWGDNPDPSVPQSGPGSTNICSPICISSDTNWVDVGFGPWTVLAIKANGTLWAFGRQATIFTGVTNQASCATPVQVGTNNDWQSISPNGWLYQVLSKKDGSLWSLSTEFNRPDGVSVKPLKVDGNMVAFGGFGSVWQVGVVLTDTGDVWTWGRVFGESTPPNPIVQAVAKLLLKLHRRVDWGESKPVIRKETWQLTRDGSF